MGLKPLKTLVVWFVLMCCCCSLVVFCIFGFLEGFVGFVKTFGKTKKKQKINISKGESETFNFVCLVFPNVCWFSLVVFCMLVFSKDFLVL